MTRQIPDKKVQNGLWIQKDLTSKEFQVVRHIKLSKMFQCTAVGSDASELVHSVFSLHFQKCITSKLQME